MATKQVELAFCGLHFGDVDVEEADRIGLELLLRGLVALDLRQPADPMALQTAMQRRAGQVRDGGLKGVEAIVERQQRMPPEGDDDRLLLDREDRRLRFFWTGRQIGDRGPLLPLGDGLLVDPVALARALRLS